MAGTDSPESKFKKHQAVAKQRGLAFTLTFAQWWALWEPHWSRRGKGSQDMCMCRKADKGGYELGNVRIATVKENQQERSLEYQTKHAQQRWRYTTRNAYTSNGAADLDWTRGRNAFHEYSEETEENA